MKRIKLNSKFDWKSLPSQISTGYSYKGKRRKRKRIHIYLILIDNLASSKKRNSIGIFITIILAFTKNSFHRSFSQLFVFLLSV